MNRRLIAILMLLAWGCSGRRAEPPQPISTARDSQDLKERGLLLLMADRRLFEPFTVETIRRRDDKSRESLAVALGRIGDRQGRMILESLLADRRPKVRRAAAFALGQLADPECTRHLLRAVRDSDLETAILAVAALAEVGAGLDQVVEAGRDLPPESQWQRLLPYLFRYPSSQVFAVARRALEIGDPALEAMAAYSLSRNPVPEARPELRRLLEQPDPWVRGWAARALGQVGERDDLGRLRPLLEDRSAGPVIQSLRAARRLIGSGTGAPPPDWRPRLLELFDDSRVGVATTAIESAAGWLLDPLLGDALERRVAEGEPREREVALMALAEGGDPRARDFVAMFSSAQALRMRQVAARAAGALGDRGTLEALFADEHPQVRATALSGLLDAAGESSAGWAMQALSDRDPAVRATALEWLIEHPVVPVEGISRAIVGTLARDVVELRLFGIRALVARALAESLERGLGVQNLEHLARVGEYPARREAAEGLEKLGRRRPAIGAAESKKTAATYLEIVKQTELPVLVEMETRHGRLRLQLDCPAAPMTCLNFLQLTRQGFFNGLEFHRVLPDFVVQAGDPRADGWGGPGYTIRDELSPRVFERGVIGMASSGPDTAGSQFFIVLSRQPHLDGRYTAFGKVVDGEQILDRIAQGDRLDRVAEIQ